MGGARLSVVEEAVVGSLEPLEPIRLLLSWTVARRPKHGLAADFERLHRAVCGVEWDGGVGGGLERRQHRDG